MGTDLQTQKQKTSVPVAQQLRELHATLTSKKDKIFAGLPRHVNPDRMISAAMMAIRDNPQLAECSPASFCSAVSKAAFYGWEIGGVLANAYLVPFRDNAKGTTEAVLIPGYRGLLDLCRRSGEIESVTHRLVHEGDHFQHVMGDAEQITHVPSSADDRLKKPVTHAYVIIKLQNGGVQRSVWTAAQINDHKERFAKGWKKPDSPWQKHWGTMAFKTILKDMIMRGLVPMSAEIRLGFEKEDQSIVGASSWVEEVDDTVEPEQNGADYAAVVSEAKLKIDAAKSLTAVDDVVFAHDQLLDADHAEELEKYATDRKDVIRSRRGDRSNK